MDDCCVHQTVPEAIRPPPTVTCPLGAGALASPFLEVLRGLCSIPTPSSDPGLSSPMSHPQTPGRVLCLGQGWSESWSCFAVSPPRPPASKQEPHCVSPLHPLRKPASCPTDADWVLLPPPTLPQGVCSEALEPVTVAQSAFSSPRLCPHTQQPPAQPPSLRPEPAISTAHCGVKDALSMGVNGLLPSPHLLSKCPPSVYCVQGPRPGLLWVKPVYCFADRSPFQGRMNPSSPTLPVLSTQTRPWCTVGGPGNGAFIG